MNATNNIKGFVGKENFSRTTITTAAKYRHLALWLQGINARPYATAAFDEVFCQSKPTKTYFEYILIPAIVQVGFNT
ncbi:MAG: hypothetical protein HF978_05455 [Desulfobacteraceae bacterium]|nr:hypothetical protein [Desulfobacteraceae bacterium]MBC2754978.1 hypothetical protein [Desulfobacteraceae bacterium]